MLYQLVDNKVNFCKFESDIFQVTNGVNKQGCVLSPSLFNLVMTDLDQMLNGHGGVQIGAIHLTGLYYADDIVLFANNEVDLTAMLDKADEFAKKWGLKFNSKKSQVLVVGKKWSDRSWPLGENSLKETKVYKYLGVLINRRLKDNSHVSDHIVSKAKKLEAYIRYTLANHSDINRVNFGSTLWHKATLPGLSHAAGIWFNDTKTSTNSLLSSQYKCAKAVLKLHSMPSRTATLCDLDWLPITDELDIKRASYYKHLREMDDSRLTKIVFNELFSLYDSNTNTAFEYFHNVRMLFEDRGVDHMFNNDFSFKTFKEHVTLNHQNNVINDLESQPSLRLYRLIKSDDRCSSYLCNKGSFKAVQLKFKLRTGTLGLGEDHHRQHRDSWYCKFCGSFETVKHFILFCDAYNVDRFNMFSRLRQSIHEETFNLMISDPEFALFCLLGDHDDIFNWCFLSFLESAWSTRQSL